MRITIHIERNPRNSRGYVRLPLSPSERRKRSLDIAGGMVLALSLALLGGMCWYALVVDGYI